MNLSGKVAIVTGAADGIGRASALAFARHGATVVLADVQDALNREAADQVKQETGQDCIAVTCDVSIDDDLKALLQTTIDRYGQCDILLNNAGIIVTGDVLDLDPNDFDRVLNVNLRSYFVLSQLVARHMIEKKIEGAIINMASLNSIATAASMRSPFTDTTRSWSSVLLDKFIISTYDLQERRHH